MSGMDETNSETESVGVACVGEGAKVASPSDASNSGFVTLFDKRRNWTTDDVAMAVVCGCAGGPYVSLDRPSRKFKSDAPWTGRPLTPVVGNPVLSSWQRPDDKRPSCEDVDCDNRHGGDECDVRFGPPLLSAPPRPSVVGVKRTFEQLVEGERKCEQWTAQHTHETDGEISTNRSPDPGRLPSSMSPFPKIGTGREAGTPSSPSPLPPSPTVPGAGDPLDLEPAVIDDVQVNTNLSDSDTDAADAVLPDLSGPAVPAELRVAQLEEELHLLHETVVQEKIDKTQVGWAAYTMELVATRRLEDTVDDLQIISSQSKILEAMLAAIRNGQGGSLEQWLDRIQPAAEAARNRLANRRRAIGEVLCLPNC